MPNKTEKTHQQKVFILAIYKVNLNYYLNDLNTEFLFPFCVSPLSSLK